MFEWGLLLYLLMCTLVLAIRHRHDRNEFLIRLALAVGLPIAGFLLPLFWPAGRQLRAREEQSAEFMATLDRIHSEAPSPTVIYKPEAVKEINVIPLEEALLVNDTTTRRRIVIDLLKQDSLEYLEVLRMAVGNEDTETSHYAVSAIMEIKRKLTLSLQKLSVQYERNKGDAHLLRSYADVLRNYMRSGLLDERTLLKYKHTYTRVLGELLELSSDAYEAYGEKVNTDLELRQYETAEHTARLFITSFPRDEEAYLALIKVYFTMRSMDQLKSALEELKRSPVRLTSRALGVVRFWAEGGSDAGFKSAT
ncbi:MULTISPECIES: hypothetical protein [Paenibacillus]|uniref:hypothetical protein n=1 Tax=Paenibacillus TaxID=44249 RepID=UPI0022B8AF24|nr:hypothetical protein [Paenibacillus caseinilyticus]MCZ8518248.1 hypothetical protein [Paenibacillus caseinilyticus]